MENDFIDNEIEAYRQLLVVAYIENARLALGSSDYGLVLKDGVYNTIPGKKRCPIGGFMKCRLAKTKMIHHDAASILNIDVHWVNGFISGFEGRKGMFLMFSKWNDPFYRGFTCGHHMRKKFEYAL